MEQRQVYRRHLAARRLKETGPEGATEKVAAAGKQRRELERLYDEFRRNKSVDL